MCMSLTSTNLLVGTSDGLIHIYDVPSHQLLRTISNHKGMSIAHLQTMVKPPDLMGHISLEFRSGSSNDAKDTIPVKPVMNFQKTRDPKPRHAHEITAMLPAGNKVNSFQIAISMANASNVLLHQVYKDESTSYSTEELLRDHAYFVQPVTSAKAGEPNPLALNSKVMELEAELENMRELLSKAKGVNDAMWETVVHKLVSSVNDQEISASKESDSADQERSRKRGRAL